MTKIISTALNDDNEIIRQEHEINTQRFTAIVHQQNIKVDVPEFIEINPQDTIACMKEMNEQQWEWISTGELFKTLWSEVFKDEKKEIIIPNSVEKLNLCDTGMVHVAGMIVLGCEACFGKNNVFYRNPETYLHPRTERTIVGMLMKMLELCGGQGTVVETNEQPKIRNKKGQFAKKEEVKIEDRDQARVLTLKWLSLMTPDKPFAKIGEDTFTTTQLIADIEAGGTAGEMIIDKFIEMQKS